LVLPSFFPTQPHSTRAPPDAPTLVVELDMRDSAPVQAALQKHGLYAEGDSIDRHLSPQDLAHLRTALQHFDMPFAQAARMKPWLLANLLAALNLERHGYQRNQGIEYFLLALADKQQMKVQELESADYQMALFDRMTESEQAQYLLENLADLDDAGGFKDAALIDAWSNAKGDSFERVMHESLAGKPASADFTRRVLLDERNPKMADKIDALLRQDGTAFVAVGALHLVGKGGVPNLLKQKGYVVDKLY
jgi:uncharacterized protein YbaP (TraB family)